MGDKPKEIIKLDPNDVQDVIMGDDIAQLNKNDIGDNNNRNRAIAKSNNKGRLRQLFGKKKKSNNDNDDNDEEVNGGDNDDNDEKVDDADKSERVLMNDDDRKVYTEFCKTLTPDSVKVISIQKVKDNANKKIVYNALL